MKKFIIGVAIIFGIGAVAAMDKPEDRVLPAATQTEQRDYQAAYTTLDEYLAVTLNARGR